MRKRVKRRPRCSGRTNTLAREIVRIVVDDSSGARYCQDLNDKATEKAIAIRSAFEDKGSAVLQAAVRDYIYLLGLYRSADPKASSKTFYASTAIMLVTLTNILEAAGIELDVDIIPRSDYVAMFKMLQDSASN